MTAREVPDRLTPLDPRGLLEAIAGGYDTIMGGAISVPCLSVLGAQASLETGNGKKIHGNNPGNRKRPATWEGDYAFFRCDELFDNRTAAIAQQLGLCHVALWKGGPLFRVVLERPHPWAAFVAFETAAEGFADYLHLLALSDRYRLAWGAAMHGDAAGFVTELGRARYFTAEVDVYRKAVVSLCAKLTPIAQDVVYQRNAVLTREMVAELDGLVALTGDETYRRTQHDDEDPEPERLEA